jgi:hypothetical protein
MRQIVIAAVIVFLGASLSAADKVNPAFFGTWKMNVAKSKADPGPLPKSQTVKIEPHGDGFMTTVDAENADGTKTHTVRMAALDGKEVTVQGGTNPNAKEAYARVSDRSFKRMVMVNGKVMNTLTATLSTDGKTFTTETTGTNADGKPIHNSGVMEKQ